MRTFKDLFPTSLAVMTTLTTASAVFAQASPTAAFRTPGPQPSLQIVDLMCSQPSGASRSVVRPPLQSASMANGKEIKPLRYALIRADGSAGSWIEIPKPSDEGGLAGPPPECDFEIAFDSFEVDPNAATLTPVGGADCGGFGHPSQRYFFGAGAYTAPVVVSEFSSPGFAGDKIGRVSVAFHWWVNGPGTSEQCYVLMLIGETFEECGGNPLDVLGSGVIVDLGVLASDFGYYAFNLDICPDLMKPTLFPMQIPADGSGAMGIVLGRAYSRGTVYLPKNAQLMLWGTQPGGATGNFTTHTQWDDHQADGTLAGDDCVSFEGLITCDGNFEPENMIGACFTIWVIPN
jgi:hypothetical protein